MEIQKSEIIKNVLQNNKLVGIVTVIQLCHIKKHCILITKFWQILLIL